MSAKHTPGPWEAEMFPTTQGYPIRGGTMPLRKGDRVIAIAMDQGSAPAGESKANAALIAALRCVRHALWRMAREARGDERTRLCTIYAEATEALADTMAWRMAGVREAVSFVLSQPGGAS